MSKYPSAQERARRGAHKSAKTQQATRREKGPLATIGVKVGEPGGQGSKWSGAHNALDDLEKAWGKI